MKKKKAEPLNLETIRNRWREFADSPGTRKVQALRSFALCCELTDFSNNTLSITVTMKMAYDELNKPETRDILRKELGLFFGTPITLELTFKEVRPPVLSDETSNENPDVNASANIDYEPLMKSAVKIFGGDRIK